MLKEHFAGHLRNAETQAASSVYEKYGLRAYHAHTKPTRRSSSWSGSDSNLKSVLGDRRLGKSSQQAKNAAAKRKQGGRSAMESALFEWVIRSQEQSILSDAVLWEIANVLLHVHGGRVSLSWVQRFKKRHGFKATGSILFSGRSTIICNTQKVKDTCCPDARARSSDSNSCRSVIIGTHRQVLVTHLFVYSYT